MPISKLLLIPALPALLLAGCAFDQELVDAPPINTRITSELGTPANLDQVQCEGPDQELALLGSLCGAQPTNLSWTRTNAPGAGMAMTVGANGGPLLIIFNEVPRNPDYREDVADEVSHAAYVALKSERDPESSVARLNQWRDGEPVESGAVVVDGVQFDACSGASWVASGSFRWRTTDIALSWVSGSGC